MLTSSVGRLFARKAGTLQQTGGISTDVRNESLAEEFSTLSSSVLRHI